MAKVFRDSVHGDISIDNPMFLEIINTPEMQRLRRVFQLGGAQYAFASATHNRFMHCLGVFEMVNKFIKYSDFKKLTPKEKDLLRLTGLLHDIGHGPFSHTFEKITTKTHEEYGADIIMNKKGNIYPILVKYKIKPKDIVAILSGKHKNKSMNLLISGQLDADRLDYLKRDSYYCGVNYAALDTDFLIRHTKIIDNQIVFPIKTIYAIESYLLGRHYMYKQVYEHKVSIAFDVHFMILFKRLTDLYKLGFKFKEKRVNHYFNPLFNNKHIPLDLYLEMDDMTFMDIIKNLRLENDTILTDLADRILNRRFFKYKSAHEFDVLAKKLELQQRPYNLEYYFVEVNLQPKIIYSEEHSEELNQNIYIQEKSGKIKTFSQITSFTTTLKGIRDENNTKKYLFPGE